MESVEVTELGRASIITLMVKQIMDRNLLDPLKGHVMRNRVLTVQIRVRQMLTTIFFESSRVRAEDGAHGKPDIEIQGDMQTLLALALGASAFREILGGRLKIRPKRLKGLLYGFHLLVLMQLSAPPTLFRWVTGIKGKRAEKKAVGTGNAGPLPG